MTDGMRSPNYLTAMEALRDSIVADIAVCESMRDKAALYNRLEPVLRAINEVRPKEAVGDGIDEITARRNARRAGARKSPARAKRSG